ncbi:hypothetical protein [Elioraea sp.]|uniref:hypothetical protein n=1 Tax=Elioraea sp. TaxID=2185103 RepID=UPI003F71DA15
MPGEGASAPFFRSSIENGSQMPVSALIHHSRRPDPVDLSPAAQVVLGAVRGWFHAGGQGPGLCLTLARAGLPAGAVARFAAALGLIGLSARRSVDMRTPGAPGLSRDEGLLLVAVAALQAGEPWRAQRVAAEWLPPRLVPRVIALLAQFAAALVSAGLRLPREPVDEASLPPAWRPERPPLLH